MDIGPASTIAVIGKADAQVPLFDISSYGDDRTERLKAFKDLQTADIARMNDQIRASQS